MQIEASKQKAQQLEEQVRVQPMSAMDAHELHQSIDDAEDLLHKKRVQQEEGSQRVSELQMQHNRFVVEMVGLYDCTVSCTTLIWLCSCTQISLVQLHVEHANL